MHPVNFEGAREIKKPDDMTDEQCSSAWARYGFDFLKQIFASGIPMPPSIYEGIEEQPFPFFVTAWKPNKEDLEALNRGEPIYIKTISAALPPMSVFTLDQHGNGNF